MKKWLPYILISLGCMWLSSCENNVEMPDASDGQVSVHLKIAFSGSGGMSARVADGDLDYTTDEQNVIDKDDLFMLVFSGDRLLDQVEITDVVKNNNTTGSATTYTMDGNFMRPEGVSSVEIVILANLVQNNITNLGSKQAITAYINSLKGQGDAKTVLYNDLVYKYGDPSSPWNISNRRIPMWGATDVTLTTSISADCKIHRAVAKVGILINEGKGIEGFKVTGISVKGAMNQGFCVSHEIPGNDGYYTTPSVPKDAKAINIEYKNLSVDKSYENGIYLPEQDNGYDDLYMIVSYTYQGQQKTGEIRFIESTTQNKMDVIRNHSYLFNIQKVAEQKLYYTVEDFAERTVNIPSFE
jgi:hypothetical protein